MQYPGRTARLFPTWMPSSGSLLGGEHRVYSRRDTYEKAIFGSAPALQTDVCQFSAQTCTVNRRYQPPSIPESEALGGRPVKQGKSSEGSVLPSHIRACASSSIPNQSASPRLNPPNFTCADQFHPCVLALARCILRLLFLISYLVLERYSLVVRGQDPSSNDSEWGFVTVSLLASSPLL